MTLKAKSFELIPEETVRIAKAAFPKGNVYIKLRDELSTIYTDEMFADLFPRVGQAAESPGRLAMVTVMQFAEGLSDRQAADAVRSRIDWKYMLGLELGDPGFDYSVLSEFRGRLVTGEAEERLLDHLVEAFKAKKLIKERARQRTDATHIQAAVRRVNRLEKVGETMRATLNDLAGVDPDWLRIRLPQDWYVRYGERVESYRLPKGEKEQQQLGTQIGEDGYQLLTWVYEEGSSTVKERPSVEILRRIWVQEYCQKDDQIVWRGPDDLPPSELMIDSPYDIEARYSEKRGQGWVGYKMHVTETCDEELPHIVVHVDTCPATQNDNQMLPRLYQDLAAKDLLPAEHLIDQGYMSSRHVVTAETSFGIETLGIPMPDSSWQAKAGKGFDASHFLIDWEKQKVTCPNQKGSQHWRKGKDAKGKPVFRVDFSAQDCAPCLQRVHCTKSETGGRRLSFRPQKEHEALQKLRQEVETETFKAKYRKRAGVEGTISQAVRVPKVRRTRYIGLAKTHLQHVATAAAINMARVFAWFSDIPVAKTRKSPLSSLALSVG